MSEPMEIEGGPAVRTLTVDLFDLVGDLPISTRELLDQLRLIAPPIKVCVIAVNGSTEQEIASALSSGPCDPLDPEIQELERTLRSLLQEIRSRKEVE